MSLIRWEFRKLLVKRLAVVLLLLILVSLGFSLAGIFSAKFIYLEKNEAITTEAHTGLDGIRWDRSVCAPFEGRTVDDAFVREAVQYLDEKFPNRHLLSVELATVLRNFTRTTATLSGEPIYNDDGTVTLPEVKEHETEILSASEVTGGEVLVYRYGAGWVKIIDMIGRLAMPAAAVGIFLCTTLYSGEYTAGCDAVLLTTKKGKRQLGRAKFIFGLLFPAALVTVTVGIYALTILCAYGFSGGTGSAALNTFFRGNENIDGRFMQGFLAEDIGVTYIGCALRSYLSVILMTLTASALALLVSSLVRSSILSVGISAALILGPSLTFSLIAENRFSPFVNTVNAYLPIGAFTNAAKNWFTKQIPLGDGVLRYVPVLAVVFIVVAAFSYLVAVRAFARHQVT